MRKPIIGVIAATLIALVSFSGCSTDGISPVSPGQPVTLPSPSMVSPVEQPSTAGQLPEGGQSAVGEVNAQESTIGSTETASATVSNEPDVGLEKAKATAFKHANVNPAKATLVKAGKDIEDGVAVYEVEFFVGNTEYEYEIDAKTGKIRAHSKDIDNFDVDD